MVNEQSDRPHEYTFPDTEGFKRKRGMRFTELEIAHYEYTRAVHAMYNEDRRVKKIYAFTQTVEDGHNKYVRPSEQFYNTCPSLCGTLNQMGRYIVFPELTDRNRIHYHGIIYITDQVKWSRWTYQCLNNRFGHFTARPITDSNSWIKYMIKECEVMTRILSVDNVCVDTQHPCRTRLAQDIAGSPPKAHPSGVSPEGLMPSLMQVLVH